MSDFVIDADGITKSFVTGAVTTTVLHGIDLRVVQGEMLYLVGPSGSGKSTLLSILGCLLSPDAGKVNVLGRDITRLNSKAKARFRREQIGFVFQRLHLFSGLRAWENVATALDLLGWNARKARLEALRLLEMVGLEGKVGSRIGELSLGQRQRVAVARALAGNPQLIFADEPTASLDFDSGHNAVKIMRDLAKSLNKTVVIVTHDSRIFPLADRIVTMENGRLTQIRFNAVGGMGATVVRLQEREPPKN